jgi:hypothetical protein
MNIKQRTEKKCIICDKTFFVLPSLLKQKYCSNICRHLARLKPVGNILCGECGKSFLPFYRNQKYCSVICRTKKRRENQTKFWKPKLVYRICLLCGKKYRVKHSHKTIFCSRECAFVYQGKRLRDGKPRRLWRSGTSGRRHEIRAKALGLVYERFLPIEIYERDRFMCWLCGKKIKSSLRYPDPKSITLDHLIPLSKGGSHTRENVRSAHLECNCKKRNNFIEYQTELNLWPGHENQ